MQERYSYFCSHSDIPEMLPEMKNPNNYTCLNTVYKQKVFVLRFLAQSQEDNDNVLVNILQL